MGLTGSPAYGRAGHGMGNLFPVHLGGKRRLEGLKTKNRTLFLVSKGYYRTNLRHEGKPDIKKLLEINKAGGLSMFSQEKYEQIFQLNSFFAEQK